MLDGLNAENTGTKKVNQPNTIPKTDGISLTVVDIKEGDDRREPPYTNY